MGSLGRGLWSQVLGIVFLVGESAADPTVIAPDIPPRKHSATVPPSQLPPTWDLDGTYLWLGPTGAASHVDGQWDSTIGASLAVVRIREGEPLGAIGGTFGASKWTERGGGRLWLDGLVGTELEGHMVGASIGPILELAEYARPRIGGSVGVWAFLGVTPFLRVGTVDGLGGFAEIGVHLALPVIRTHHASD